MDIENQIDTFNRYFQVSRETIISLKNYEKMLIKANKNLNLVGKSTIKHIWIRHFLDSSQVIDFIDKNCNSMIDIGSGAGFPGLPIAILFKEKKKLMKIKLLEKSPKKTKFLKQVISALDLNVEVESRNIFESNNKINDDIVIARAFKPLDIILELIHNKATNWKKILVFLGKTGNSQLLQASKIWNIEYKQRVSLTSEDSRVIEITKLEKKYIEK